MSRPPSEPGWYWAKGRHGWVPAMIQPPGNRGLEMWNAMFTQWGPRIPEPTEPPAPSLEDDVRALAELAEQRASERPDSEFSAGYCAACRDMAANIRARLGAGGGT